MYFFLQDEAEEFTVPSFKAEIVRPFQNYSFFCAQLSLHEQHI